MVAEQLRDTFREFPVDLAAVLLLVGVIDLSLLAPGRPEVPPWLVVELGLVAFLPGYAVVAALFPEADGRTPPGGPANDGDDGGGITTVERLAFSLALSVAVVPLIGLVLNATSWGLQRGPLLAAVSGFVVVTTLVAAARRLALPEADRFEIGVGRRFDIVHATLFDGNDPIDRILTVCLVLGVAVAVVSVGYAASVPASGERTTEFYLLTEDDDGDLVAGEYPTEFERGESRPVVLRVGNDEYQPTEYTVVVVLQEVRSTGDDVTVLEQRELDRLRTGELGHDDTWTREYDVAPTMTGERLRLTFLLYRGAAPDDPSVETAYRNLQLYVNVSAPGAAG